MTFAIFWSEWPASPRKVAKAQCEKKYTKAASQCGAMVILKGLQAAKREWAKDANKFVPMPATWLNQARWEAFEDSPEYAPVASVIETTKQYLKEQAVTDSQKLVLAKRARELKERFGRSR